VAVEAVEAELLKQTATDLQVQIEADVLSADGHQPTAVAEAEQQDKVELDLLAETVEVQVRL
jgi:hypothetical protein